MSQRYSNRVFILILALCIIVSSVAAGSSPSFAASFRDVDNHWAKSYVETVSDYKAISGYPDGTFKPNDNIKRIEFISLIVNSQGTYVRGRKSVEFWGQPYIEAAIRSGLISSNEFGNMDETALNRNISREEMASIVVNAYTQSGGKIDSSALYKASTGLSDFSSVSPDYRKNAIASVALELISGYPNGTFAPDQFANRAEAAVITYRLLLRQGIIENESLPVNVTVSKDRLQQGDMIRINVYHASSPSGLSLVQNLYPGFKWYDSGGVIHGYIPTNYHTSPGVYSLKLTDSSTGDTITKNVEIVSRDFRVQYLTVDPNVEASTRNEEAYTQYRKYFNPSREVSSSVKYYSDPFILPTKGRITTEFGETRTVNGAPTTYRHSGLDIAAPTNTDVLATNSGKVTLAMNLTLTGNSIVIDHGEGLFSVYFHLEKMFVSKGDMVKRGQLIGGVGSTGFSTGPHLHFTMSHYAINMEPGYLIYNQPVTKNNYQELMK
ncbi:peptidoglycan DD-metalloendopeptidase family protein [Gudongella sp. SC589]|uniref:peptidoglycan DD-metalloendopeptidase family protein n=1 Tax=Gudongella sp. SC589 TaxID=3385990 RepID=UPI003904BCB5